MSRDLFDFNGDGEVDFSEMHMGLQMMASSRQEAIDLTGDDTFYCGDDDLEDSSEYEDDWDDDDWDDDDWDDEDDDCDDDDF